MDLRETGLEVWIVFIWLRIGIVGGLLWMRWWTFGFWLRGFNALGVCSLPTTLCWCLQLLFSFPQTKCSGAEFNLQMYLPHIAFIWRYSIDKNIPASCTLSSLFVPATFRRACSLV
jgi:hypothetical protein